MTFRIQKGVDLVHRWLRLPLVWISAGVVLIALALTFLWPCLRDWRGGHLARLSLETLDAGNYPQAQRDARAAFLLAPGNVNVLRCLAFLNTSGGYAEALPFFTALEQKTSLTPDDELAKARALLSAGWIEDCGRILERLRPAKGNSKQWLFLSSDWFLAQGDIAGGLALLEAAQLPIAADNRELRLRRLALAWKAGDVQQREAARAELHTLLAVPTSDRAAIVAILATDPKEDPVGLLGALGQEAASPKIRLLRADLRIRANPAEREAIVAELVDSTKDEPASIRRTAAVWLARQGSPERALELLPPEEALQRNDLLLARLDSLAALGRWKEIEDILPASSLAEAIKRLFLARVLEATDRAELASLSYEQAARLVQNDPASLCYVADYLERIRREDLAIEVWRKLASTPAQARFALENVARLQRATKDTTAYQRTIDTLVVRWPMIFSYQLERLYLRFLLHQADETDRAHIQSLQGRFPHTPFVQLIAVLNLVQQSEGSAAKEILDRSHFDVAALPPSQQVIVVMILQAQGDSRAAEVAKKIPRTSLLPKEIEVLQIK